MKLNKKGFVSSAVLYSLLLLFLALILGLLALLSNRKQILDKLKGDIKSEINKVNAYTYYEDGTAIYYNPVTGKMCGDYKEENSVTGVTEGCLKWYTFNDDKNKATINMILDHNTSGNVAWASLEDYVAAGGTEEEYGENGNNDKGPLTANKRLKEDTEKWENTARLISADEIAKITGANETLDWDSSKQYSTPPAKGTSISWFYLDGAYGTDTTWQTQVATSQGKSKYAWLFDNTYNCKPSGCNNEDNEKYSYGTEDSLNVNNIYGYWTSNKLSDFSYLIWDISASGGFGINGTNENHLVGVRPVITLSKKDMSDVQIETVYDYTGGEQRFITPTKGYYKVELWGAQGGTTSESAIGGKGAYTTGVVYLENETLYLHVGGEGSSSGESVAETVNGGYNGGGATGGQDCCGRKFGTGGGATDVRLVSGSWDNETGLKSRIMVAAGGGGAFQNIQSTATFYDHGGYGGTLIGGSGAQTLYGTKTYCYGYGGNQLSGGSITTDCTQTDSYLGALTGSFGIGGTSNAARTGGGGGYYGGSRSGHVASAGGGSSYISGYLGSIAITSSTDLTPRNDSNGNVCTETSDDSTCSYHYSNIIFKNADMINGNESMPNHANTASVIGNSGNGYAKITYCGQNENDCSDNNVYLIDHKNFYEDVTGGFDVKNINEESWLDVTKESYVLQASYTGGITTMTSKNKIDLTNYKKIVFKGRLLSNLSNVKNITKFGIVDTIETTATNNFSKYVESEPVNEFKFSAKTLELDISDVKGSKYIKIAVNHTNHEGANTAATWIDKVYLVK